MTVKNIYLLLFLLIANKRLFSQNNQGRVNYQMIEVDTINNKINIQDSIYSNFVFKPNKTKWEMGLLNRAIITKTILNQEDFYLIMDEAGNKTATHGEMPNQNSFNQLLNYQDTSLLVTKTPFTKNIAGRLCKKIILKFKLPNSSSIAVWYDETIDCKSIIPGAGLNGKPIKGLILEYEMQSPVGKMIVTATSVNFENITNSQFNPNLNGYQITELNREDGRNCNGHH